MLRRNAALFISSLLFANVIFAATNGSSTTPSQGKHDGKTDIELNIQGDTHHVYQGEIKSSGPQMDDSSLSSDRRIQTEALDLIKNKFRKYNINITVSEGTVVLKGYIESDEIKQNIERDVRKIPDVKNVNNLLNVKEKM